MSHLQKLGGVAALINAAAYTVGIGLALTLLAPVLDSSPEQYLTFLAANQTLLYLWHFIIYLVAGVFMVPLVLAVHERFKAGSPALMQLATAFGLIVSPRSTRRISGASRKKMSSPSPVSSPARSANARRTQK